MYQISSTRRCATARETCPAASSKWAMLPPARRSRTRTDEPSGAAASGAAGSIMVSNGGLTRPDPTAAPAGRQRNSRRVSIPAWPVRVGSERPPGAGGHRTGGRAMARIVVTEFVSLDGVMEEPRWTFQFDRGPEGDKFKYDELFASEALLLGRVTYQGFAQAWPSMGTDD